MWRKCLIARTGVPPASPFCSIWQQMTSAGGVVVQRCARSLFFSADNNTIWSNYHLWLHNLFWLKSFSENKGNLFCPSTKMQAVPAGKRPYQETLGIIRLNYESNSIRKQSVLCAELPTTSRRMWLCFWAQVFPQHTLTQAESLGAFAKSQRVCGKHWQGFLFSPYSVGALVQSLPRDARVWAFWICRLVHSFISVLVFAGMPGKHGLCHTGMSVHSDNACAWMRRLLMRL